LKLDAVETSEGWAAEQMDSLKVEGSEPEVASGCSYGVTADLVGPRQEDACTAEGAI
jgi:hypothetical protein